MPTDPPTPAAPMDLDALRRQADMQLTPGRPIHVARETFDRLLDELAARRAQGSGDTESLGLVRVNLIQRNRHLEDRLHARDEEVARVMVERDEAYAAIETVVREFVGEVEKATRSSPITRCEALGAIERLGKERDEERAARQRVEARLEGLRGAARDVTALMQAMREGEAHSAWELRRWAEKHDLYIDDLSERRALVELTKTATKILEALLTDGAPAGSESG